MQVTKEKPVHHRRIGYANTGYAFHLVRCLDHKDLRDYVKAIPSVRPEPWFKGPDSEVPDGFTVCRADSVFPDLMPEAVGDFLCEVYVVVVADNDVRRERRRWHHEIGHACDFGQTQVPGVFRAKGCLDHGQKYFMNGAIEEFPGMCNELLCEAVDCMFEGDVNAVVSGFESLFPWLAGSPAPKRVLGDVKTAVEDGCPVGRSWTEREFGGAE